MAEQGVVIGSGFMDRQWKLSVLTKDGELWLTLKEDIFFSIPSICSSDLANRCGAQPVPETSTQLNARIEVLKRIRQVERDIENAMVALSQKLLSVYEMIRAKDPNDWAEVTVTEVAKLVHKKPTAVEILATHKLLMNNPVRFVAASAYQTNQIFRVRPLNDVKDVLQVQEWVRARDPLVEKFIVKAKEVMGHQKPLMESTRREGPSLQPADHAWTPSDKTIIRFLIASLRHGRAIQVDPYIVSLGFILRRVYGLSSVAHIDDIVHKLLVEIGVFTPWQDLIVIERSHKLDLEMRPNVLKEREQSILRALTKSNSANPTHPDDFYGKDPMAPVRHDWGDMPVYVVDDASAEELDDGISIQQIPSEPGNVWVHVHVADPGSLIPPTNFLAQKAAEQSETWYMVPKSFPLFPKCITHHPTHGLSLGTRSKNGIPDRVMTFSVKLDSKGDILDYAVRAGLVRNVKILNYDNVDATLGFPPAAYEYPFGNQRPPSTLTPLTPDTTKDMQLLRDVADAQRRQRLSKNWFSFDREKGYVERVGELPVEMGGRIDAPQLHRGFPKLTYIVEKYSINAEYGTRAIIAEMMKLACRAASRFCTDKNLPVLRRTSNPMVPVSEEAIDLILKMRDETGYVHEEDALRYIMYTPGARYTTTPGMHYGLGVPEGEGYVRVTSPLRRYADLVVHWQIQQALLAEKGLAGARPRFDMGWMEDYGVNLAFKDQYIKGTLRRHQRFWSLLYIKRWRELFAGGKNRDLWPKDAQERPIEDPLEGLEGYLVTLPVMNRLTQDLQMGLFVPRLGLKEIVSGVPAEAVMDAKVGMFLPVRVKDIYLGVKPLLELEYDKTRGR